MKTLFTGLLIAFTLLFLTLPAVAQSKIWTKELIYNTSGSTAFSKVEADTVGYVYNIAQNTIWKQTQQNGTLVWSVPVTYAGITVSITDAVIDLSGHTFLTGYYAQPGQGSNIVTMKYDQLGAMVWATAFNGSANIEDKSTAIAVDQSGNIVITGYTNENTAGTATTMDAVTIKYTPGGTQLALMIFNGLLSKRDKANDIVTDNSDNIYIIGSTEDYTSPDTTLNTTFPFPAPGTPLICTARKMFLVKYNSAGTFQWVKKNATTLQGYWNNVPSNPSYFNYDEGYLMEIASNKLYVAYDQRISPFGAITRTWSLTNPVTPGNLKVEPYIASYDLSGNLLTNTAVGGGSSATYLVRRIKKMQADFAGNIYVNKLFNLVSNFYIHHVTKYSPSMAQLFSKTFELKDGNLNFDMNQQHLFIASYRQTLAAMIKMDTLTKYSLAGVQLWTTGYAGNNAMQMINDVTIDDYGDPYVLHNLEPSQFNRRITIKFCNNVPTVNLGPDISICLGDTVTLNPLVTNYAFPGTAFKWNTSTGLSDSTIISPLFFPQVTSIFTFTTTLLDGCSAADQVKIKVPIFIQSPVICNGSSFTVNGHSYTMPGDYIDTLSSAGGVCDSLIYTHLTVANNYTVSAVSTICLGDSILLGGAYQTQAGVYVDSLQSVFGCDSVVTTTLTVNPSYNMFSSSEICQGDSTLFMGIYYHASGTYTHTLQTVNGCDSSFTLQLLVRPTYSVTTNFALCNGDSVLIFGQYRHLAGTYVDSLQTMYGCDSIRIVQLQMNSMYLQNVALEICSGDSILLEGAYQTQSGVYVDSLQSVFGCDSVLTTTLTVRPDFNLSFSLEICQGDSAYFLGSYHHTSGTHNQLFQSVFGCDSSVTYQLQVHPVYSNTTNLMICSGDSTLIFGQYEQQSGTYTSSMQTVHGCDSIEVVQLQVNPGYFQQLLIEICSGDSVLAGGSYQTQSGIYTDSLQTTLGCDSITVTTFVVHPVYNNVFSLEICQGDSAYFFGSYHHTSGTYNQLFQSIFGCDSSVTYQLQVHPVYSTATNLTICSGDSTLIFGQYEQLSGTYTSSMQTVYGCDSIEVVQLQVNPGYLQQLLIEICEGDSALVFNQYENVPGIYSDSSQTVLGCDSITVIALVVHPVFVNQLPVIHLCNGDSAFIFGQYEFTDGLYYDTLQTVNGCDSILIQEVDLLPMSNVTINYSNGLIVASPPGLSYSWLNCSTGQTIPGQNGAVFAPVSNGTYAAIGELNGCVDTSNCFTTTVIGLGEEELFQTSIFPNPTSDKLTIDFKIETQETHVTITALSGEIVLANNFINAQSVEMDVSQLAGGNYIVSILSERGISRHELVILP